MAEQLPQHRLILPYFEDNWQPDDMFSLRKIGATTVVFCITEEDITTGSRERQMCATIDAAHQAGLETQADLWGVANTFGGEAPSKLAPADSCPDNPKFQRLIQDGIAVAADSGVETMFWDEPHLKHCSCHGGKEVAFIESVAATTSHYGLRNSVCFTSSEKKGNLQKLDVLAANPHIDSIGTDPYYMFNFPGEHNGDTPEHYVGGNAAVIKNIASRHGKRGHIWAQGFGIPFIDIKTGESIADWHQRALQQQWAEVPLMQAEAAVNAGVTDIGVWASRDWNCASALELKIQPPFPEKVWANIGRIAQLLVANTEPAKALALRRP